jgi:hypothetical protein
MIIDPDSAEPGEPIVTLRMTLRQAEKTAHEMADLLCWCSGYMAALGDNTIHAPMGVEQTRELRLALLSAIRKAKK